MDCKRIDCDILIVGAGPAGGSAAYEAASKGLNVVILEKRYNIGLPVQCAEYIPSQLVREIDLPSYIRAQKIECMQTHMPDGQVIASKAQGFIIHRDRLDKYLVEKAINKGARLYLEAKAISYDRGVVLARQGNTLLDIAPKIIIGADGPLSTVGSWMESINQEFMQAAQYVMPLRERENSISSVYFSSDIPGGYGWVFPKQDVANVGVGVNPGLGVMPGQALASFTRRLVAEGVVESRIIKRTGGLIPVGGLLQLHDGKNIILVGDAGGLVHPITGAGIASAVLSGKLAAGFAWHALVENDLRLLAEYELECNEFFFDAFDLAHQKRKLLEEYWQRGSYELSEALKWGWIAFEEYYKNEWTIT